MKLINLTLENFRGIKNLSIDFNGKSTQVYGDNGTGKTTINDAFCWLMFDSPSTGEKYWTPKTEGTHNMEHTASMIVEHDGIYKTFRKVFHEVYKNKKGYDEAVFSGHTTDHYINDFPVSEKEYKAEIEKIVDTRYGKALSKVGYFAGEMSMKDRRAILMELFGNVSDDDVIKTNEELFSSISTHDMLIENRLKGIKSQLLKSEKELKKLVIEKAVVDDVLDKIYGEIKTQQEDGFDFESEEVEKIINVVFEKLLSAGYAIADEKEKVKKLENEQFALEEFIRTKIRMITGNINLHFDNVSFRMFDEQVNGDIKEDCEPMIVCNGVEVPYKSANTGTKINAGLDIIYALARATGTHLPIFVDNAESVTKVRANNDEQIILLSVKEGTPDLMWELYE